MRKRNTFFFFFYSITLIAYNGEKSERERCEGQNRGEKTVGWDGARTKVAITRISVFIYLFMMIMQTLCVGNNDGAISPGMEATKNEQARQSSSIIMHVTCP